MENKPFNNLDKKYDKYNDKKYLLPDERDEIFNDDEDKVSLVMYFVLKNIFFNQTPPKNLSELSKRIEYQASLRGIPRQDLESELIDYLNDDMISRID